MTNNTDHDGLIFPPSDTRPTLKHVAMPNKFAGQSMPFDLVDRLVSADRGTSFESLPFSLDSQLDEILSGNYKESVKFYGSELPKVRFTLPDLLDRADSVM